MILTFFCSVFRQFFGCIILLTLTVTALLYILWLATFLTVSFPAFWKCIFAIFFFFPAFFYCLCKSFQPFLFYFQIAFSTNFMFFPWLLVLVVSISFEAICSRYFIVTSCSAFNKIASIFIVCQFFRNIFQRFQNATLLFKMNRIFRCIFWVIFLSIFKMISSFLKLPLFVSFFNFSAIFFGVFEMPPSFLKLIAFLSILSDIFEHFQNIFLIKIVSFFIVFQFFSDIFRRFQNAILFLTIIVNTLFSGWIY